MIRRFWRENVRQYMPRLLVVLACSIVTAIITASPAGIMKYVIDDVLFRKDMSTLLTICVGLIVLFVVKGVFYFGQHYLMAHVGQSVLRDLRRRLFSHLQYLPVKFFEDRSIGQVMSRTTSDILVLQNVITSSIGLVADFLTIIGLVSWAVWLNWKLAVISFLVLPLIGGAIVLFSRRLRRIARDIQRKTGDLTGVLQENLSAIRIVKAHAAEECQVERFEIENRENFRVQMKNFQTNAILLPVVELLNTSGLVLVMGTGGWLVVKSAGGGNFSPGDLISFLTAIGMLMTPMKHLTNTNSYLQQMRAALERIYEVLDEEREDLLATTGIELPPIEGGVEFKDVNFRYPGTEAGVTRLSFLVEPGRCIALVGPSGSGKTTLVNLLQRFYKTDRGSICIDDHDISTLQLASLRRQFGVVPQEPVLFSWSVADNIRLGLNDVPLEAVVAAAKQANAHEFIMSLPQGYETPVGDHGVKLSGGQRQRIAIARAIVREPRILILDEATSALDSESEKLVQEALERVMKGRTTFVIAHRLSTIRHADEILVLRDGCLAERGNHDKLMSLQGIYHDLVCSRDEVSGLPAEPAMAVLTSRVEGENA